MCSRRDELTRRDEEAPGPGKMRLRASGEPVAQRGPARRPVNRVGQESRASGQVPGEVTGKIRALAARLLPLSRPPPMGNTVRIREWAHSIGAGPHHRPARPTPWRRAMKQSQSWRPPRGNLFKAGALALVRRAEGILLGKRRLGLIHLSPGRSRCRALLICLSPTGNGGTARVGRPVGRQGIGSTGGSADE